MSLWTFYNDDMIWRRRKILVRLHDKTVSTLKPSSSRYVTVFVKRYSIKISGLIYYIYLAMTLSNVTDTQSHQRSNETEEKTYIVGILITCEIINSLLIVATIWLLTCMIVYGMKTKRWSKRSRGSSNIDRGTIYIASLFAIGAAIPRLCLTEVVFNAPRMSNGLEQCEILVDASNTANYVTTFAAYFFLWLRQRTIYGHPSSRNFAGKKANIISYVWLAVLTVISIAVCYVYVAPDLFDPSPYGCVLKQTASNTAGVNDPTNHFRDYFVAGALVLSQVTLLALFLYPLVKSSTLTSNRNSRVQTVVTVTQEVPKSAIQRRLTNAKSRLSSVLTTFRGCESGNRVSRLIRRSLISACIAVVADLFTLILVAVFLPKLPAAISMVAYNISNFIKAVCVLSTFGFYKKIFTVICRGFNSSEIYGATSSTEANTRGRYEDHSMSLADVVES